MKDVFFVRYQNELEDVSRKSRLKFSIDEKGLLSYTNESPYGHEQVIRKQVWLSDIVLEEVRATILRSGIFEEKGEHWPKPRRQGRQTLTLEVGKQRAWFQLGSIGSQQELSSCRDEKGLKVLYYLVLDLKHLVLDLLKLHYMIKPIS